MPKRSHRLGQIAGWRSPSVSILPQLNLAVHNDLHASGLRNGAGTNVPIRTSRQLPARVRVAVRIRILVVVAIDPVLASAIIVTDDVFGECRERKALRLSWCTSPIPISHRLCTSDGGRLNAVVPPGHLRGGGHARRRNCLASDSLATRDTPHDEQWTDCLYLPEYWQHKILDIASTRIRDNEEHNGQGVQRCALDQHCGDTSVGARMVRRKYGTCALPNEHEACNDESRDKNIETRRNRPIGDTKINGRLRPQIRIGLGKLE